MKILGAGAIGSIGFHVVNTTIKMGHHPVTLVRTIRKVKLLLLEGFIFTAMFQCLKDLSN